MNDLVFYAAAFVSACVYAYILERTDKWLEPDFTWVEVALGVALTGGWVAARIEWGSQPNLSAIDMAWWTWQVYFFMFLSTGIPIALWQTWQMRQRFINAFRFARGLD